MEMEKSMRINTDKNGYVLNSRKHQIGARLLIRSFLVKYDFVLLCAFIVFAFTVYHTLDDISYYGRPSDHWPCDPTPFANKDDRFKGNGYNYARVPNVIHTLRFGANASCITEDELECLSSIINVQYPSKIYVHTEYTEGALRFVEKVKNRVAFDVDDMFIVKYVPQPKHVFGLKFNEKYQEKHARDVTKLKILRRYGGVFMDNDVLLAKHLHKWLPYEMTAAVVASADGGKISGKLIAAHKDSRFLKAWLNTYHWYNSSLENHWDNAHVNRLFHDQRDFIKLIKDASPMAAVTINGRRNNMKIWHADEMKRWYYVSSCFLTLNHFAMMSDAVSNFNLMPTIVVTGFGPFGIHRVNASWEAVKLLPCMKTEEDFGINLIIREIPVVYETVDNVVNHLWNIYFPDMMIHVGVSGFATKVTVESNASKSGYLLPDSKGCVNFSCTIGGPENLVTRFDLYTLLKEAKERNVDLELSHDGGRYLCEYIYYSSLCMNSVKTIFIHVPMLSEIYTPERIAHEIKVIISLLLKQIYPKRSYINRSDKI